MTTNLPNSSVQPEDDSNWPRSLLLTSNDGTQTGRSGYGVLSEYIPNSRTISYPRQAARSRVERFKRRIYSFRAASTWHQMSSHSLENQASKELAKGGYDLVHMLWADRDWGQIDRICKKYALPLVTTVHACGCDLEGVFPHPKRLINSAAYILMSQHQKAFFINNGISEERVHVVPHGIDIAHFRPARQSVVSSPIQILSVGSYRRNFPLLTRLIEALESDRRFEFILVSRESFRESFSRYRNVRFLSGVSNEALLQIYQEASVLLITAEDATANNALLEALACGLPVVCEKVGGLTEYATKDCAIHTEPNSVKALVQALNLFAEDEQFRNRFATAARKRAESLSWERSLKKLKDIYINVCRQP